MAKYRVIQSAVTQLLEDVRAERIAIPELQRPFVWDSVKVRDLMDSLYKGYPVGYLITWQSVGAHLKGGQVAAHQQILIDGQDVSDVTQKSLREHIAVVFQEPALFSGSVRENVAYARPNATDEEIWAAVRAANAEKFVRGLPQGLDTEIGERGVKLSGGQRQRLAIARAILKDAPILILDEATSSLDSKAEHEVQAALDELMKGRTTLIIAHRLSTIARVDKIVGLRGGRVAEEGSPAELAQGEVIYAELLALQNPTEENKQALERYDIAR